MLTTTHIKRTVVLAAALLAVAAPSATARPADAQYVPGPVSASQSRNAEPSGSRRLLDTVAANREAQATKSWRAANPRTAVDASPPEGDGFDLVSAGIGAAIALTVIMVEAGGRRAVRRRRATRIQHGLA